METTYGSEYRPKESGYKYSGSESESIDTVSVFSKRETERRGY